MGEAYMIEENKAESPYIKVSALFCFKARKN